MYFPGNVPVRFPDVHCISVSSEDVTEEYRVMDNVSSKSSSRLINGGLKLFAEKLYQALGLFSSP